MLGFSFEISHSKLDLHQTLLSGPGQKQKKPNSLLTDRALTFRALLRSKLLRSKLGNMAGNSGFESPFGFVRIAKSLLCKHVQLFSRKVYWIK